MNENEKILIYALGLICQVMRCVGHDLRPRSTMRVTEQYIGSALGAYGKMIARKSQLVLVHVPSICPCYAFWPLIIYIWCRAMSTGSSMGKKHAITIQRKSSVLKLLEISTILLAIAQGGGANVTPLVKAEQLLIFSLVAFNPKIFTSFSLHS